MIVEKEKVAEFQLKDNITVMPFDGETDNMYLLEFEGRYWKISEFVRNVIVAMKDTICFAELEKELQCTFHQSITKEEFSTIKNFLISSGLMVGSDGSMKKKKSILWLRIPVLSSNAVQKVRLFIPLFRKPVFCTLSVLCAIWLLFIYCSNTPQKIALDIQSLSLPQLLTVYILTTVVSFLHEFGHASALMKNGERPGQIGVGIYFVMMVFFSDVTAAWKLPKKQRFLVDCGGIYFQAIAASLLYIINLLFIKSSVLLSTVLILAFSIINNFNPFIKLDGYWMLADFTGSTNVFKSALALVKKRNRLNRKFTGKEFFLILYLILFAFFAVYFTVFIIQSASNAINTLLIDFRFAFYHYQEIQVSFMTVVNYISNRFAIYIVLLFLCRLFIKALKGFIKISAKKRSHNNAS